MLRSLLRRTESVSAPDAVPAALPSSVQFAVIDVETTGLFLGRHDRVIEIAVVVVDDRGTRIDSYSSLVNPERDLGPTGIHGVRGRDVADAPQFRDIVGDVCSLLQGRLLVAHNARFDRKFLAAEFRRCGLVFPEAPWLCTMELAASLTGHRRLGACCDELGIEIATLHSAFDDAAAAADLLACCLVKTSSRELLDAALARTPIPSDGEWPTLEPSGLSWSRSSPRPSSGSYIGALLARLPAGDVAAEPAALAYLELLDRALEDRKVTPDEVEMLHEIAEEWGVGREAVVLLHDQYVRSLAAIAWQDGVLTDAERADLEDTASALGMSPDLLAAMLDAPFVDAPVAPVARLVGDFQGKSVCFTGQLTCTLNGTPITREQAHELTRERGVVIKESVTKQLDVLVVADPESLSGKARKARDYGTRIVVERAFWRDLGVPVD
jgi:DNA polymerase-3 subunit epsilon